MLFTVIGDAASRERTRLRECAPGAEAHKVYVVRSCTVVTRSYLINKLDVCVQ
jgi:hypothetical protein